MFALKCAGHKTGFPGRTRTVLLVYGTRVETGLREYTPSARAARCADDGTRESDGNVRLLQVD